jgi:hypothetical protein
MRKQILAMMRKRITKKVSPLYNLHIKRDNEKGNLPGRAFIFSLSNVYL